MKRTAIALSLGLLLSQVLGCAESNPPPTPPVAGGAAKKADAWKDFDVADLKPDKDRTFKSPILGGELVVKKSVFHPVEAEARVLPLMDEVPEIFKDKRVLEIGTGSGIISIHAAQLGATKVVSTDINPQAIASAKENAENLGVGSIVSPRLVPETDMSAYSVIEPDEIFDVIISNPPYSLDMTAKTNTPFVDTGDLGFSIVEGLKEHLTPDGVVILLYDSAFYHKTMVEFARYRGYEVDHNWPWRLFVPEAAGLFNCYREKLLEREGLAPDTFVFEEGEIPDFVIPGYAPQAKGEPLFAGKKGTHPGFMVIRPPSADAAS